VHEGVKISKVSKLNEDELHTLVIEKCQNNGSYTSEINALKMAMFEFNQVSFDASFDDCVAKYGAEKTFTEVLGEFIAQLGVMWQTNTVSITNEHFVSNLIKQKLYCVIDGLRNEARPDAKTYLLYLPANELHEIGLLYLQYHLRSRGDKVIFLGQNTPSTYLCDVYEKTPFNEVISVFTTSPNAAEIDQYFDELLDSFQQHNVTFKFCGNQVHKAMEEGFSNQRIHLFKSVTDLKHNLV
jgi:methanogenic corrinoid protein MtbC1